MRGYLLLKMIIVTAVGSEGRKFAIEVARKLGFECSDIAMTELDENYTDDNFIHYLTDEQLEEVEIDFDFLFSE